MASNDKHDYEAPAILKVQKLDGKLMPRPRGSGRVQPWQPVT